MEIQEPSHPNLDMMLKVKDESNTIGEFIEQFLKHNKKIVLAQWREGDEEEEEEDWHQPLGAVIGTELRKTHTVTRHYGPELKLVSYNIQRLLAEFYGIDYDEMERERARLLEYVRKMQEQPNTKA